MMFGYQLSVRNGASGKPSLLKTSGIEVSSKQNLTATGFVISFDETRMVFPSIFAAAGTNFLSAPATKNCDGTFPVDFNPVIYVFKT
jgi:hypothetical protein